MFSVRRFQTPEEFYQHASRKDGRQPWCKQCAREYKQEYQLSLSSRAAKRCYNQSDAGRTAIHRYNHSAKGIAARRRYENSALGRQSIRRKGLARWRRYPERGKAKNAVGAAVRAGKLPPVRTQICSDCGTQAQQYHHLSYAKERWLDVEALCGPCHRARHSDEGVI